MYCTHEDRPSGFQTPSNETNPSRARKKMAKSPLSKIAVLCMKPSMPDSTEVHSHLTFFQNKSPPPPSIRKNRTFPPQPQRQPLPPPSAATAAPEPFSHAPVRKPDIARRKFCRCRLLVRTPGWAPPWWTPLTRHQRDTCRRLHRGPIDTATPTGSPPMTRRRLIDLAGSIRRRQRRGSRSGRRRRRRRRRRAEGR